MKESGVLSNIWSKYKLQKAEVCNSYFRKIRSLLFRAVWVPV